MKAKINIETLEKIESLKSMMDSCYAYENDDADTVINDKHEKLRNILISYGCEEYGDCIVDEISELFNFPTTPSDEDEQTN